MQSVNNAERDESRLIDAVADRHVVIALIARNRALRQWAHFAVDGIGVITELLELCLNTGDDLVRRFAVGPVNRLVVLIIRVGVVTPRRVPPAVVPAPPTPVEKDQRDAMMLPPIFPMMMVAIACVNGLRLGRARSAAIRIP